MPSFPQLIPDGDCAKGVIGTAVPPLTAVRLIAPAQNTSD
jgi:hypothetical protein